MSGNMRINNDTGVQVITYRPKFSTICSIGKAPFWGEVIIRYRPKKYLLEFEAFEDWLFSLSNKEMTIEHLCQLIADKLIEVLGDIHMSVEVQAMTTVHAPVSAVIRR